MAMLWLEACRDLTLYSLPLEWCIVAGIMLTSQNKKTGSNKNWLDMQGQAKGICPACVPNGCLL